MTKKHDVNALNVLYTEAEGVDYEVFAEMRSNVLLVSGDHYNKRQSTFYRRIRDSKELSQELKLRLTKNHTQRICKTYVNNIMSMGPGVGFEPKDDQSNEDQKAAELHHAVWLDAIDRYNINDKMDDWCDNFVEVGEVAVKIFFDPSQGKVKAYHQALDEDGAPLFDADGNPAPDEGRPVYAGEFQFEEVYGFNLLRPVEAKDLRTAAWLGLRKMVDRDKLIAQVGGPDAEAAKFVQAGPDETFVVFDGGRGGYRKTTNQVMVREYYFRPCPLYPKGWFYITTKEGILFEDELPGGVFPIIVQPFDKIQTTPRGRSPVKTIRPYQAEINRSASKMAEHQITLGDDKLLIQNGTKISAGVALPGVRSVNYTGMQPGILQGRSGEQYMAYMTSQITELYDVMMVAEDSVEKDGQLDPYALLFRSASQKKKFQRYTKRFEKFLLEVCKTYLALAKLHMPDDQVICAVGSNERVNMSEFKNSTDFRYNVKVVAQADDIETKMGKQLVLNHVLQYVGNQLKPEDIGKIMRQMPYANFDKSFDDMTVDYDSAQNDILALDRGELPPIQQYDNHVYAVKRLVARMRQADFKYLSPQIQQNYQNKIQVHEQMQSQQLIQMQRAEQGYIPSGGYLVTCDFYVNDPADPNKTRRARLPYESIQWLVKHLEAQGQGLDQLETMNQGAQAQIAGMVAGQSAPGGGTQPGTQSPMGNPNGMGSPMGQGGAAMPQGAMNGNGNTGFGS